MFAFPSRLRLRQSAEFDHVFTYGSSLAVKGLRLLYCPNQLDNPRLGVIIAKRQIKLAVRRNAIRRRLRESFRLHQHQLGSHDIIILVNRGVQGMVREAFNEQLEQLWQRLITGLAKSSS